MASATIALYTGTTAPLTPLDAESLTVGGTPVLRERMMITGASELERARVQATTPDGSEMGLVVRVTGPIPAGTAAIGKLAANSGVDIGDIDVLSLVPGTGQTALGKAIDVAAGGSDTGVAMLAVRRDALVTLTPADGDWVPFYTNAFGALWVELDHMPRVIGSVAHGFPDTQFPVKIGGRASTALRAAVAGDDRVDALFDADGALVTRKTAHAHIVNGNASNTDGTSTSVIAAAGAGIRTYITAVALTNAHATQFAYVEIKDGTTVVQTIPVPPAGGARAHYDPPLRGTANTAWNFDPSAAITTLTCSMHGYTSLT
jgi:hypothetical protein